MKWLPASVPEIGCITCRKRYDWHPGEYAWLYCKECHDATLAANKKYFDEYQMKDEDD